jgi:hypothetical protein
VSCPRFSLLPPAGKLLIAYRLLIAVCALAAPLPALPQLAQLCPADARTAGRATLHNDGKRTVAEIFGLVPGGAAIEFASPDWTGRRDALDTRIEEVLRARPRFLAPQIIWAEGADLRSDTFSAALRRAEGGGARLTVSGYQVCVRDGNGDHWFFRNVSADVWSD